MFGNRENKSVFAKCDKLINTYCSVRHEICSRILHNTAIIITSTMVFLCCCSRVQLGHSVPKEVGFPPPVGLNKM